jgi:hypothetical protein
MYLGLETHVSRAPVVVSPLSLDSNPPAKTKCDLISNILASLMSLVSTAE